MRSSSRLYWICQAAGWGSFLVYVLIGYLATAPSFRPWDFVSIFVSVAVLAPLVTHWLRLRMHQQGWLQLPGRPLLARLAVFVVAASFGLTALVALGIAIDRGKAVPVSGMVGVLVGFAWAFSGWVGIYYAVHARRRRDAMQFELNAIAREAQMQALRAQLNPHFLFNCLNSLRHLILSNPERAASMVTGLSELLRYSLVSDARETVTLNEELAIVDEYLELEHVRFEERLRIERAIDDAARPARIPPMLIQPLVDNAIKHGIADLPKGGVVRIEARAANGQLHVVVSNTGRIKPATADGGHGLRNAAERLRLLHEGKASLTLDEADGMTRAVLVMPLEVGPERAAR